MLTRIGLPTKDEYVYKPCIGSVGHPKICVQSGIIVQINLEPLITSKLHQLGKEVVITGQEVCGTRTGSI